LGLRVLVPSQQLAQHLDLPGITPILWHINDDPNDAPPADVLITERPRKFERCSRVSRISGLRHVHLLSIGYEWILEYLPDVVGLSNSRGAIEEATAEHCLALILAMLRDIPGSTIRQHAHDWNPAWHPTLQGATVLVLGQGGVGRQITARLIPFRPDVVIRVARSARTLADAKRVHAVSELPELLPRANVVVIAVPHDSSTEKLVDSRFLQTMQDGALLVNVGRGAVVDTDALLAELGSGRLRAALDVTDPEPLPGGHPLWDAPGCLITPHVGGNTQAVIELTTRMAVAQIQALASGGELRNIIRQGPAKCSDN